jgi:hypothetical protein
MAISDDADARDATRLGQHYPGHPAAKPRMPYVRPTLTRHGTLRTITMKVGNNGANDHVSNSPIHKTAPCYRSSPERKRM